MKLKPIPDWYLDLIVETSKQICKEKGWFNRPTLDDVLPVLMAVQIVNIAFKKVKNGH